METFTFLSVNFSWQDVKTVNEEAVDFEAIADKGIEPVPDSEQPVEPAQPVQDVQPPPQIVPGRKYTLWQSLVRSYLHRERRPRTTNLEEQFG